MDFDEAIKLLTGGKEGVREWNQRRKSAEENPVLSGANLSGANLDGANLGGANLDGANLGGAYLSGADLSGASFDEANLIRANLIGANLIGAYLSWADLIEAILFKADLSGANLGGANLRGADLSWAILVNADLSGANLDGACLSNADLSSANLTSATLYGALIVNVDLRGAKLCDCRKFGISVWNARTDQSTEQNNLVISDEDDPLLTIDNLNVAQFIHLLLNNEEIRGAIDTITSKVVLILGRFSTERKALLDALRQELRCHDYLPVMFDFEKPASRSYTETISTLARMARFVIVDLTDAHDVRAELATIVPNLGVPVQPLILASQTPNATFDDFRLYHWVLNPFRYETLDDAIASLPKKVLGPAEAKYEELKRLRGARL